MNRVTVPVEAEQRPYLTPDGRLLIWYPVVYSQATNYRIAMYDFATQSLTVVPSLGLPGEAMLGNSRRAEAYLTVGEDVLAFSPSGSRVLPSPPSCATARVPRTISADGRRLLAACSNVLTYRSYVVDLDSWQVIWLGPSSSGVLSADGEDLFKADGASISKISLATGTTVAHVTGPDTNNTSNYLHIDAVSGRLVAIGLREGRVYEPAALQTVSSWPVPWSKPVLTDVFSVAIEAASGRLFMTSGSQVLAAGTPFGEYHVLEFPSGRVLYSATAGARGIPDVGAVVAAAVPLPPQSVQAVLTPSGAQLSWTSGGPPATVTRYLVDVGSAPGLSDIYTGLDVGLQNSIMAVQPPSGRYYLRVRAANVTGSSAPSSETVLIVP